MKQIIFTAILIFAFCFTVFAQANENSCPNLTISSSEYPNNIQVFTVEASKEIEKYNAKYKWMVKGGKIIAGNATKTITFWREASEYNVMVKVEGLPENCGSIAGTSGVFDPPIPRIFQVYGNITIEDEEALLDSFFIELKNDPMAEGVISVKDDKDLLQRLKFLNNHIKLRNFDRIRISFLINSKNEQEAELWIVSAGANMPDCKNCITIKAEDLDKLENLFRPKPTSKIRKK